MQAKPDWHAAAASLVSGIATLDTREQRIRLLDRLCNRLGHQLYPALLHILYNIGRFADAPAKAQLTDTLVHAMQSGRMPSGRLTAWGSQSPTPAATGAFGRARTLGPLEFLCSWYAQPSALPALARSDFVELSSELIALFSVDDTARTLYCRQLAAEAEDPLDGTLSNKTRAGLAALADAWSRQRAPADVVAAFLDSLSERSLLDELSASHRPF